MIFNSLTFVLFFLVVYSLYLVLHWRWQNAMLLVASYIFYGWWDWRFCGLLLFSPLVDWADLDGAVLIKNDCFDGATIVDGKITLPERPGIGALPR